MLKCLSEGAIGQRGVCRVPVRVPQWACALRSAAHVRSEETTALCWTEQSGCLQVCGACQACAPKTAATEVTLVPECTCSRHMHRHQRWHHFPGCPSSCFERWCLQVSIKLSLHQLSTLCQIANYTTLSSPHPNQKQYWLYLKPVASEVRGYFQLLEKKT